jgi:monoamine oxidase
VKKRRIVVIGGGIAGLYAAWRLKKLDGDADITVYEADDHVGGRIDTAEFAVYRRTADDEIQGRAPAQPVRLKAELGAMRFPTQHRLLLSLYKHLYPKAVISTPPDSGRGPFQLKSLYHLRGLTLSEDSFRRGKIPYRVRPEEVGKTPAALLEHAIFSMLKRMIDDYAHKPGPENDKELTFLNKFRERLIDHDVVVAEDWLILARNDYKFAGVPLRNVGFWNVLKHFLSSEAFLLVHDGFGFLSVISNWNALEAFKWLLTDFSPHLRLQTVPGGLSQIVTGLEQGLQAAGIAINVGHILQDVHWERSGNRFRLRLIERVVNARSELEERDVEVLSDHVILAMPPSALRRIRLFDGDSEIRGDRERDWKKLVNCSRPHRLSKIVLAYEEPWWQHTSIPLAETGRVFTDLPMRQIHYFGPGWLAENGWCSDASRLSLVMVYNDSHYEAFWRTFHVHDKVHRVHATSPEEDAEETLGRRPETIRGGSLRFWGPRKTGHLPEATALNALRLREIDDGQLFDRYEVRHRMEEKVREQLTELHGYEVPMAIGGVYRDWSDDGGWHTWEPFVDVAKVKDVVRQPFCRNFSVRPCGRRSEESDLPLYVCGEAYAWEQGWIEGALMTAEAVVNTISGKEYKEPDWLQGADGTLEKYMCAELPQQRQSELIEAHVEHLKAKQLAG